MCGPPKVPNPIWRGIVVVGIAVVERRARSRENEKRVEVRLEQHVDVHPLSDVTAVAHVARHRIESIRALSDASLDCEPRVEVSHVIDAGHSRRDLLLDLVRAEVAVLIEELRQVWSNAIAGRQAAKQSRGCYCAASLRRP